MRAKTGEGNKMKRATAILLALCLLLGAASALGEAARVVPVCGNKAHYKGDGLDHSRPQSCWVTGHFSCDGQDHAKAPCGRWGHFNCDPKPHDPASCGAEGHFVCDGKKHGPAPCGIAGHCIGDDKRHTPARCGLEGHYNCLSGGNGHKLINQFCNLEPKHHTCQEDTSHYCDPANGGCGVTYDCTKSGSHTPCLSCGLLWCDDSLGGHYTPCGKMDHRPCAYALGKNGNERFRYSDHEVCDLCDGLKCGAWREHGEGKCAWRCKGCGVLSRNKNKHLYDCGRHYSCRRDERAKDCCAECRMLSCNADKSGGERHCDGCADDCYCMVGERIHRYCKTCGMNMCSSRHSSKCSEFQTLLRLVQAEKL